MKKRAFLLFAFVFLVWGSYRALVNLPEWADEFFLKPLIFVLPVIFLVKKEKKGLASIGLSLKNLFKNIYFGLGLGAIFALAGFLTNYFKYGGITFASYGLTIRSLLWLMFLYLATAFSEETLFRGYIFTRLFQAWKKETTAGIISAALFALIHFPIVVFVWHYNLSMIFLHAWLSFLLGLGNAFLMAKTKTIVAPVITHTLWGLTVFLFR